MDVERINKIEVRGRESVIYESCVFSSWKKLIFNR